MTVVRLHNEDWGFETNCFVCEPRNERGLRIPFFHDTEQEVVTAEFELGDDVSGAPTLVHGGVVLAVLDEAMAWACIAIGGQWAVTTQTACRFHRAVRVGQTYRVVARVVDDVVDGVVDDVVDGVVDDVVDQAADTTMRTSATILDARDVVRAEATATFTTLGQAQATRIVGAELDERARSYVNDGPDASA